MNDPFRYEVGTEITYNPDRGELSETETVLGQEIRRVIEVRRQLFDDVLRQAVIVELERLGYTVIPPETSDG